MAEQKQHVTLISEGTSTIRPAVAVAVDNTDDSMISLTVGDEPKADLNIELHVEDDGLRLRIRDYRPLLARFGIDRLEGTHDREIRVAEDQITDHPDLIVNLTDGVKVEASTRPQG